MLCSVLSVIYRTQSMMYSVTYLSSRIPAHSHLSVYDISSETDELHALLTDAVVMDEMVL